MSVNLIGKDIEIMRKRYDEALTMQGIPAKYQFPNFADSNYEGEPEIDNYCMPIDTHIFFDGNPKVKTFRRYGWVVANDDTLPFLIHCSWNLPNLQADSIFRFGGQYTNVPDKVFRVTQLTYDIQAPDHIVCQCVPVYDEKRLVGYTDKEIELKFNKSHHFIKQNVDYRGQYYDPINTQKED